ncbi:hypothetical protein OKW26_004050 [Paraburkholderia sp. 32]
MATGSSPTKGRVDRTSAEADISGSVAWVTVAESADVPACVSSDMQNRAQAAFERTNMVLRSATKNPSRIKVVYRKALHGQLGRATAAVGTGLIRSSSAQQSQRRQRPRTSRPRRLLEWLFRLWKLPQRSRRVEGQMWVVYGLRTVLRRNAGTDVKIPCGCHGASDTESALRVPATEVSGKVIGKVNGLRNGG